MTTQYDHAIVYTDGSHTTSPVGSGSGIHAYMWNGNIFPEEGGFRITDTVVMTRDGYKTGPVDAVKKLPAPPDNVQVSECVVPVPKEFFSDVGELVAFINVFRDAPFRAKRYTIYSDSSYVVNAVTMWMDNWKKKGWRRGDGTPIANLELVKEISAILDECKEQGIAVHVKKIKAHAGHYGNEKADELARRGSAISALNDGTMYHPYWSTEENLEALVEEDESLKIKGLSDYPAICTCKFCYAMVGEEIPSTTLDNGEQWNYMLAGNHAKNKDDLVYVGKMVPDTQFAVLFTKGGWENIYALANAHSTQAWSDVPLSRQYNPIALINNEFVKRKIFVAASANGIPADQMYFSEDRNVWFFDKLAISRLLRPALLSYRVIDIRDEMAGHMSEILNGNPGYVLNDITDKLFDEKGKPVKDFYRNVDKSFTEHVKFADSDKKVSVILSRAIDIPSRTEINRIKEPEGRWYVVTWRPEERYIRYGVVYLGKEYNGLWCGYYSAYRILREEEL